jgi:hypothetical protein
MLSECDTAAARRYNAIKLSGIISRKWNEQPARCWMSRTNIAARRTIGTQSSSRRVAACRVPAAAYANKRPCRVVVVEIKLRPRHPKRRFIIKPQLFCNGLRSNARAPLCSQWATSAAPREIAGSANSQLALSA